MKTTTLREELHGYIDSADDDLLKVIYEILQVADSNNEELSSEHKRILDERLKAYYANPEDVITLEDLKAIYKKK
jgi:hypothetical protein